MEKGEQDERDEKKEKEEHEQDLENMLDLHNSLQLENLIFDNYMDRKLPADLKSQDAIECAYSLFKMKEFTKNKISTVFPFTLNLS